MKTIKTCTLFLFIALALFASYNEAAAQGTAFTYQGRLNSNGSSASGNYDFTFALFPNSTGSSGQIGGTLTNLGVGVTNGLFTVTLDFGANFPGLSRWLAIGVRTNGGASFTPLSPLQQLTPTPYAIYAPNAGVSASASSVAASNISGAIPLGQLPAAVLTNGETGVTLTGTFTGNGGGLTNLNAAQLIGGTVPDARLSGNVALLNGNQSFTGSNSFSGLGASLTISGTGTITPSLFTGIGFQFFNNSGEGAIMSSVNDANSSLTFYTKPGPGFLTAKQMKLDRYGSLMIDQQNVNYGVLNDGTTNGAGLVFGGGGGEGIASQRTTGVNKNGLDFYTGGSRQMSILNNGNVGIGTTNPGTALQVSGTITATAFSGNGGNLTNLNANNLASGTVPNGVLSGFQGNFSTVGGGSGNTAGNNEATVSGGFNNIATGQFATVPGGNSNVAGGKYSFAAGRQAQATNQGAFVWADSQNAPFNSTNQDSFNVRAQGGANFVTSGAGLTVDGSPVLTGITGSNLTGLNASQLTTGTVADARLSGNVALLNGNQSFTGSNTFSGLNASLTITGTGPITPTLFTGIGFQFYNSSGEGAIMSSLNDDHSSLTFYTKPNPGVLTTKQVKLDRYGVLMIDQENANYGALNDGTTNADGLVFGTGGGEGIASQRTTGVNKNGLDFYTGGNRQMSILSSGNVGIGTTNPSTALQVSGTVTATAFSGGGGGLTGLNANNLSSGTVPNSTLPSSPTFSGTVTANAFSGNGSALTSLNATQLTSGTVPLARLPSAVVTNSEPLTILNTVDVTSLFMSGKITLPLPAIIAGASLGNILYADGNANSYFGSSAGSANAGTSGSYNTGIGNGALSGNTTGGQNVAVGVSALGNSQNDNNLVAVGFQALLNDNAGSNGQTGDGNGHNTAIGYEALQADNFGAGNTATGYKALGQDSNGSFNTAMGDNALNANTSGSDNVAIGTAALQYNTGDNELVAIGYFALQNDNAGNNGVTTDGNGHNTAIGYEALQSNSGGVGNTGTGYMALQQNMSGSFNTAYGDAALSSSMGGSHNVGIGDGTLNSATGSANIAIGSQAGVNVTFGDHNIYIGNAGAASESGVIRIGSTSTGTATYLVGTVNVPVLNITGGSDLAEPFQIAGGEKDIPQGAVVVIDEANPGYLKMSDSAYDAHVAGVVSGANGIHPGIQMQQEGLLEGGRNVALTGRVYVQADASNGAIKPGDLLTTSGIPGRAMKVSDHQRGQGAILGKAMTGLKDGQGMVLVLVTLQ